MSELPMKARMFRSAVSRKSMVVMKSAGVRLSIGTGLAVKMIRPAFARWMGLVMPSFLTRSSWAVTRTETNKQRAKVRVAINSNRNLFIPQNPVTTGHQHEPPSCRQGLDNNCPRTLYTSGWRRRDIGRARIRRFDIRQRFVEVGGGAFGDRSSILCR